MKQTPILSLTLLLIMSQVCVGQEASPKKQGVKKSPGNNAFKLKIDAGKPKGWIDFIRQQKALTVVKTSQGLVPVDFEIKSVEKPLRSIKALNSKFAPHPHRIKVPAALSNPLFSFLEASGHGSKKAMRTLLFFPKKRARAIQSLIKVACYQRFIDVKDVTEVVLKFRKDKVTVGVIEFREQGKLRRF